MYSVASSMSSQTKEAPNYWRDFSEAICTGNGRAGLWAGTEEETGTVPLSKDAKRSGKVAISFNILKNVIEELYVPM
jgi:hypothetical protein